MATRGRQRIEGRRRAPAGLIAGALAGWILVVVVGAGDRADSSTWLGVKHVDVIFMITFTLIALAGLILIIVLKPWSGEWKKPDRRSRTGSWVLMIAVLILLVWRPQLLDNFLDEDTSEETAEAVSGPAEDDEPEAEREPVAEATDVLAVLVALAAAGAVWAWTRREIGTLHADEEPEEHEAVQQELVVAIDRARRQLLSGSDARSAVLAAYATLEAVLARQGMARDQAETPTEHMRRVMRQLPIDPEPLISLSRLYEIARFSEHPISAGDQHTAGEALESARNELAAVV